MDAFVPTADSIRMLMLDREMDGWCGPDAGLLSTSTYPGCIDECAVWSNCNAVRYVEESKVCNLMSACTDTNKDSRWRHATKPSAISLGMVDREMDGWCGPDAGFLSTSTYPGCIDECAARSNCNAVRYLKESKVCNLMSACTDTNKDSRWRHATKRSNRRLSLSPHGERRLVGAVDIDYTITPQQIANWTAEAEPSSNKLEDDDGASVGKHLPVLV